MALVTRVSKFAMLTVCNVASNAEHHEHLLQQCEGLIGALPGLFDAGTVKLALLHEHSRSASTRPHVMSLAVLVTSTGDREYRRILITFLANLASNPRTHVTIMRWLRLEQLAFVLQLEDNEVCHTLS